MVEAFVAEDGGYAFMENVKIYRMHVVRKNTINTKDSDI